MRADPDATISSNRFSPCQLSFGPLSIVDIGKQYAPAKNGAVSILQRETTNVKPTVDTIKATMARFDFVGLAGLQCVR